MLSKKIKIIMFVAIYILSIETVFAQKYKLIFTNTNIKVPEQASNEDSEENVEFLPGSPYSLVMNNSEVEVSLNSYPKSNWTFEFWAYMDDWSVSNGGTRNSIFTFSEDISIKPLNIDINMGRLSHYRGEAAGEVMHYDVSNKTGWNHIAITQERTGSESVVVKMFLNGSKVDEASGDYENLGEKIWFGYDGAFDSKHWTGKLDNIRLWDIARTESQIQNNYNTEIDFSDSNLAGAWLIDNTSQVINDSTPNNNNGVSKNVSFSNN